jgi:uncharacterized membrane protein
MLLTLLHHPDYLRSQEALARLTGPRAQFPASLAQTWQGLAAGPGRALSVAGLLLLILTPVMRVVASTVAFALQRDWRFTALTFLVLLILIASFLLGKAG